MALVVCLVNLVLTLKKENRVFELRDNKGIIFLLPTMCLEWVTETKELWFCLTFLNWQVSLRVFIRGNANASS